MVCDVISFDSLLLTVIKETVLKVKLSESCFQESGRSRNLHRVHETQQFSFPKPLTEIVATSVSFSSFADES